MQALPSFEVFYQDYASGEKVSSSAPEIMRRDRLVDLFERLLTEEDNYIGVIDPAGRVLQCYRAEPYGPILLELLSPEGRQLARVSCEWVRLIDFLEELPARFPANLFAQLEPEA